MVAAGHTGCNPAGAVQGAETRQAGEIDSFDAPRAFLRSYRARPDGLGQAAVTRSVAVAGLAWDAVTADSPAVETPSLRHTMQIRLPAAWFVPLAVLISRCLADELPVPEVRDARLQLALVAREPGLVTPVGLAADREGRLFIVESHTHQRGSTYEGPPADRIVVCEDADGDGELEPPRVYADGLQQALAVALSSAGELYAVQMKSVVHLRDADRDGLCEVHDTVLRVDTSNNNHHGVLLALAFDDQDRLIVSLGNIGGAAYTVSGSDGRILAGEGDTGLIVRCRKDGSALERLAVGFWNPCALTFDTAGRLLATDNDPDARGPNRVLHIIAGGDYGYRSRYGPSGRHPYCAWNGELPGTLPMLAGVGEAPVGLLDARAAALPADYADSLLVCVWGTNEVVRVRTQPRGTSLEGQVERLIVGDAAFRPTGIAAASDGSVYIADWADRRYPVHGQGRLWRLSARPGIATFTPAGPFSLRDAPETRATVYDLDSHQVTFESLLESAADPDPFVAGSALTALATSTHRSSLERQLTSPDALHRRTALLALRRDSADPNPMTLSQLLRDPEPDVRRLAMIWSGEARLSGLLDELHASVSLQAATPELFETFLATHALLRSAAGDEIAPPRDARRLDLPVDQSLLRTIVADEARDPRVRTMAVRYLTDLDDPLTMRPLQRLTGEATGPLAVEAVRSLASSTDPATRALLRELAVDPSRDVSLRCEAIAAHAAGDGGDPEALLPLLRDARGEIAVAAARALTSFARADGVQSAFQRVLKSSTADGAPPAALEQWRFALGQGLDERPQTDADWDRALQVPGDPVAGRRVFFDRRVSCAKCHRVAGRGGAIGPELTGVSASKTREKILDSLLHPSREASPDYQGYVVVMQDGRMLTGTQFHFRGESAELLTVEGIWMRFPLSETEEYGPLDTSLMPENLVQAMSVSELRDLLAFLINPPESLGPQRTPATAAGPGR
jgi:hypothetical protein